MLVVELLDRDIIHHAATLVADRRVARLAGVHVAAGPAHRDFGQGFYTTTLFTQARALALRRARGVTGAAAVIRFRLDRNALADLESLASHTDRVTVERA